MATTITPYQASPVQQATPGSDPMASDTAAQTAQISPLSQMYMQQMSPAVMQNMMMQQLLGNPQGSTPPQGGPPPQQSGISPSAYGAMMGM